MAAAVTLLGAITWNTNSGTKTVTATPAVNDLIVIVTAHSGNTSAATPTDDNSSGAYQAVVSAVKTSSADTLMFHIRTALVASAVSTIFTHAPGTSTGGGLAVLKVTGMTLKGLAAALQNQKQEGQTNATPAPVFGAVPQSGNPVIGVVFNSASPANLNPRSSPAYTELGDVGYVSPTSGLEVMSINSGETSATITWGSSTPVDFCDVVVELDSSSGVHQKTGTLAVSAQSIAATPRFVAKQTLAVLAEVFTASPRFVAKSILAVSATTLAAAETIKVSASQTLAVLAKAIGASTTIKISVGGTLALVSKAILALTSVKIAVSRTFKVKSQALQGAGTPILSPYSDSPETQEEYFIDDAGFGRGSTAPGSTGAGAGHGPFGHTRKYFDSPEKQEDYFDENK